LSSARSSAEEDPRANLSGCRAIAIEIIPVAWISHGRLIREKPLVLRLTDVREIISTHECLVDAQLSVGEAHPFALSPSDRCGPSR
jgi:hypothetical protein